MVNMNEKRIEEALLPTKIMIDSVLKMGIKEKVSRGVTLVYREKKYYLETSIKQTSKSQKEKVE